MIRRAGGGEIHEVQTRDEEDKEPDKGKNIDVGRIPWRFGFVTEMRMEMDAGYRLQEIMVRRSPALQPFPHVLICQVADLLGEFLHIHIGFKLDICKKHGRIPVGHLIPVCKGL